MTTVLDEIIHGCDSFEKIQACLNCKQTKCTNCHSYGGPALAKASKVLSEEVRADIIECIRQGVKQRALAKKYGVSDPTISRWISGLREEGAL